LWRGIEALQLLFLSSFYPPYDRGGFEQLCYEVACQLYQRNHTVSVLTSRYGVSAEARSEDGVMRSLYLQANVDHYRVSDFFLKRSVQEQANMQALRQAIDQTAPDLLVIWGMWNLSRNLPYWAEQWLPGRVAYYLASTWPVDLDIHEAYWQLPAGHALSEMLKRPLRTLALSRLQHEGYPPPLRFENAACVSQYIHTTLAASGRLPLNASVIYNGIDPEPFLQHARDSERRSFAPLRLLYFGSLLLGKGVHTAIEALGLLKLRGMIDRVELTITGSGHPDYEERLHTMVETLGICEQVRFTGYIPRNEIPSYLQQFDVYLFTSCGPEAMARTVMEAMASGLLVIGAETGGQVEMLNNLQNALTFQAEDAEGLADQIVYALEHPAQSIALAEMGQQTVLEQFTMRRMVDELENYLYHVADTKR
jgi:glycosyltransferase involved in cell wall biosynthesis